MTLLEKQLQRGLSWTTGCVLALGDASGGVPKEYLQSLLARASVRLAFLGDASGGIPKEYLQYWLPMASVRPTSLGHADGSIPEEYL